MDKILLDITVERFPKPYPEKDLLCVTFIFPKQNQQPKLWLKSQISVGEFLYTLSEFLGSTISKLLLNNQQDK